MGHRIHSRTVRTPYRGGGMRTTLARQERMGPQAMGWRVLSRQTSTAVR